MRRGRCYVQDGYMRTLAILAGIVLSLPCSGTMLVIDTFTTDEPLVSAPGSSGVRSAYATQSALDALGGHRDLVVSRNSGGGSVTADVGITLPAAFNYASAAFARGSAVMKWEGAASDSTSAIPTRFALRADVTNQGRNNTVFFGAYSDLGVDVMLTFYQSASRFVTAAVRVAPGYDPEQEPVLTDFYVPFSEFSTTGVLSPSAFLRTRGRSQ